MFVTIDDLVAEVQKIGNRYQMNFQENRDTVSTELGNMKKADYRSQYEAQALSLRYEDGLLVKEVGENIGVCESYAGDLIRSGIVHMAYTLANKEPCALL